LARCKVLGVDFGQCQSQAAVQANPAAPVMKKTQRQLIRLTITATSGAPITAPSAEPVLKTPNANDRSREENHSDTAFAEPGNPPPSPSPKRNRYNARPWN